MPQQIRHRKLILVWTLALLVAVLFVHLYLLNSSPFLDEGDHVNTGRLLLHGKQMYKDAFNEKGPGLYWITALLFKIFGEKFEVVRHGATFFVWLTILLLVLAGVRYNNPLGGLAAATIFALFHIFLLGRLWTPETVLTPLALSVLLLLRTESEHQAPTVISSILAGLLLFFGTYIKQTLWVMVIVVSVLFLATAFRRRDKLFFKAFLLVMAGLAVPWLAILAHALFSGTLTVFLSGYFFPLVTFNLRPAFEMPSRAEFFIELPIWWTVVVTLFGAFTLAVSKWNRNLLFSLFLFQLLVMPPAFFAQHFQPLLVFSALGFSLFLFTGSQSTKKNLKIAASGIFCLLLVLGAFKAPRQYRDRIGQFHKQDWLDISKDLAKIASPGEPIFVFPHDSTYYFLAKRDSPGPHAFLLPWTTPPKVLDQVMQDIEKRPPKAILYMFLANCTPSGIYPHTFLSPLLKWISDRYRIEQIYPNRAVLLVPNSLQTDAENKCQTKTLLFSNLVCHHQSPDSIQRYLSSQCGD